MDLQRQPLSAEPLKRACQALAATLEGHWAVVGGAAVLLLTEGRPEAPRRTEDVDIVVLQGQVKAMRAQLARSPLFEVDTSRGYAHYVGDGTVKVPIDILAPPTMFKGVFTASTPLARVSGVPVLRPVQLLAIKLQTRAMRNSDERRYNDVRDIAALADALSSADLALDAIANDELAAIRLDEEDCSAIEEQVGQATIIKLLDLGVQTV